MIGPTFPAELAAAGLVGPPISWQADGTVTRGPLTVAQSAALDAVIAAHDPTARLALAPAAIDARRWIERLPLTKQTAIIAAGMADPTLMLWVIKAAGAQAGVVLDDPDTIAGLAALVTAGVITADDKAALLAP